MDVNAIVDGSGDEETGRASTRRRAECEAIFSPRPRCRRLGEAGAENPYWILDTVEMKTAWHPIGV